ncbi:MAG: CBS domain-containing protein, partial [Thermoplasmata archaeon]
DKNAGALVVVREGKPVGMVTSKDFVHKAIVPGLDLKKTAVYKIMSSPLKYVEAETPMNDVARFMVKHNIKRVAVLENGRLVGFISQDNIIKIAPFLLQILQQNLEALKEVLTPAEMQAMNQKLKEGSQQIDDATAGQQKGDEKDYSGDKGDIALNGGSENTSKSDEDDAEAEAASSAPTVNEKATYTSDKYAEDDQQGNV